MRALIIGATGATGKDLVDVLSGDSNYTEVVLFVRRCSGIKDPKLIEIVTDFDRLENVSVHIRGDVLFSCLGTTLKAAGSKAAQRHIDYDIPLEFAELARSNGVDRLVLLSAYGADAKSWVFYSRLKGKLEHALEHVCFDQYIIFRPGSLIRRNSDRTAERFMNATFKFLNVLGVMRRFRPLSTTTLAEKLAKAPQKLPLGKHVVELEKIFKF